MWWVYNTASCSGSNGNMNKFALLLYNQLLRFHLIFENPSFVIMAFYIFKCINDEKYFFHNHHIYGRGAGGEWIHVYVWPSHFAERLRLSQHC